MPKYFEDDKYVDRRNKLQHLLERYRQHISCFQQTMQSVAGTGQFIFVVESSAGEERSSKCKDPGVRCGACFDHHFRHLKECFASRDPKVDCGQRGKMDVTKCVKWRKSANKKFWLCNSCALRELTTMTVNEDGSIQLHSTTKEKFRETVKRLKGTWLNPDGHWTDKAREQAVSWWTELGKWDPSEIEQRRFDKLMQLTNDGILNNWDQVDEMLRFFYHDIQFYAEEDFRGPVLNAICRTAQNYKNLKDDEKEKFYQILITEEDCQVDNYEFDLSKMSFKGMQLLFWWYQDYGPTKMREQYCHV